MQPTYLTKQNQGRDAVRALICKALGIVDEALLVGRWGTNSSRILKAAIGGISTTDTAPDEGTIASDFFAAVAAQALIGKLPLRNVPFHARMLAMTQGTSGYWCGQMSPKALSRPVLAGATLTPLKCAALIVTTSETIRLNNAESLLQNDLVRAVTATLDEAFVDASNAGIADTSPASVTNAAPTYGGSGDPRGDLQMLMENFSGNLDAAYLITDPLTAVELALYRDAGGSYPFPDVSARGGSLLGFPLLTSRSSPRDSSGAGQMTLLDPSLIAYAQSGIALDMSSQTSLLMDDGPGTPSDLTSLYQTDSVAFKAEAMVNWQVQTEGAVSVLTGVNYGSVS